MKRICFELSEDLIKRIEDAMDFKVYDSEDLEYAIDIILQINGY